MPNFIIPFRSCYGNIVNNWLIDWLIDWLFNGTSTQKGQFEPTAGKGIRLKSAKDGERDTMHKTSRYTITIVCSKTLQLHKRNNQLSNRGLTCLLIRWLAPSPMPRKIPHTLFDIYKFIRCGCSLTSSTKWHIHRHSRIYMCTGLGLYTYN